MHCGQHCIHPAAMQTVSLHLRNFKVPAKEDFLVVQCTSNMSKAKDMLQACLSAGWCSFDKFCGMVWRSPTVKGSRSAENMCMSWPFQPRRDTKALMMRAEPMVKQIANLEGARMMMGRNREKARTENSSPAPSSARNQVKFMVLGMLDCALYSKHACSGTSSAS